MAGSPAAQDPPLLLDALLSREGYPLAPNLRSMLADEPEHLTERRGCGFTQTTRVLAQAVHFREHKNGKTPPESLFEREVPTANTVRSWCAEAPHLYGVWLNLLADIVGRDAEGGVSVHPFEEEHEVGSCAMAEKFFLEVAHGFIPRAGWIRVFLHEGTPALIEKVGMGDVSSALSLVPLLLHGVLAPQGSLFAVKHDLDTTPPPSGGPRIKTSNLSDTGVQFLRLTTLVALPDERPHALGHQLWIARFVSGFVLPKAATTLNDVRERIEKILGAL